MKKHIDYLLEEQIGFLTASITLMTLMDGAAYLGNNATLSSITALTTFRNFVCIAALLLFMRGKGKKTKIASIFAFAVVSSFVAMFMCYSVSLFTTIEFKPTSSYIADIVYDLLFAPFLAIPFYLATKIKKKPLYVKSLLIPIGYLIILIRYKLLSGLWGTSTVYDPGSAHSLILCILISIIFIFIPMFLAEIRILPRNGDLQ